MANIVRSSCGAKEPVELGRVPAMPPAPAQLPTCAHRLTCTAPSPSLMHSKAVEGLGHNRWAHYGALPRMTGGGFGCSHRYCFGL